MDSVESLDGWNEDQDRWADLEVTAGRVTEAYSIDEIDLFNDAFYDMELLMREHLRSEDGRATNLVSIKDNVEEAWKTFVELKGRLTPRAYKVIALCETPSPPITSREVDKGHLGFFHSGKITF